jgi:hypothetical protein
VVAVTSRFPLSAKRSASAVVSSRLVSNYRRSLRRAQEERPTAHGLRAAPLIALQPLFFDFVSDLQASATACPTRRSIPGSSAFIHIGQYFDLISIFGLQHCGLARTIIGTTFDYHDLLAYSADALIIFIIGLLAKYHSGRQLAADRSGAQM